MLAVVMLFASLPLLSAQNKSECNSKEIRQQMLAAESMKWVKLTDTTLGFRVQIGAKVKIIRNGQVVAEVNTGSAYVTYKQSAKVSGKNHDFLLLIATGDNNRSYLFVDTQEIRQLEPKLQNPNYDYFQTAISGDDILFDFSKSGKKTFHLGIIKDNVFCDGGETPQ